MLNVKSDSLPRVSNIVCEHHRVVRVAYMYSKRVFWGLGVTYPPGGGVLKERGWGRGRCSGPEVSLLMTSVPSQGVKKESETGCLYTSQITAQSELWFLTGINQ
jgi:hypothetical protein